MGPRFATRRIPGTAILAVTNGIAAAVLLDTSAFASASALVFVRMLGADWVWGFWFLAAAVALTAAAVTRRWWLLNVGSVISLFAWTAIMFALVAAWFTGEARLSPIALALAWWMAAGQAAMLIVPLLSNVPAELDEGPV